MSSKCRKSPAEHRFKVDLNENEGAGSQNNNSDSEEELQMPWLTDDEFPQKCRVTIKSFQFVLGKIEDHPAFESKTKRMAPPQHQLMVFLKCVGTERSGANNSNQRNAFGVEHGTADACRSRVCAAPCDPPDEHLT